MGERHSILFIHVHKTHTLQILRNAIAGWQEDFVADHTFEAELLLMSSRMTEQLHAQNHALTKLGQGGQAAVFAGHIHVGNEAIPTGVWKVRAQHDVLCTYAHAAHLSAVASPGACD